MIVFKKLLTILYLLTNVMFRRKKYTLTFIAEQYEGFKRWYYFFPDWGFDHAHLEMVSGADALCNWYSKDGKTANVKVIASKKDLGDKAGYDHYVAEDPIVFTTSKINKLLDKIIYGRSYHEELGGYAKMQGEKARSFWICPVTLFVLGRYPKHLYVKAIK